MFLYIIIQLASLKRTNQIMFGNCFDLKKSLYLFCCLPPNICLDKLPYLTWFVEFSNRNTFSLKKEEDLNGCMRLEFKCRYWYIKCPLKFH